MLVAQSSPTLWDPMDCGLPSSSVQGISWARILEWVAILFSQYSSQPRDQTQVSCIEGNFLPFEPPGKLKSTVVGNHFLLQEIFLTQGMKLGFPGFPGGSEGKASACSAGDPGSILASGRAPGEGNGNPLQYSCLENSMDRGAL